MTASHLEAPAAETQPTGARLPSPDAQPAAVMELSAIKKSYGTAENAVEVLHGIDLSVARGEFLGIVGPSGSGKSTLLHIMGMLDRPTSGTIKVAGLEAQDLSDREISRLRALRLGFVFQQFFLLDHRSALENVSDGLLYAGVPRSERLARAENALDAVGLRHRLDHRPSQLSGGECQRVAIARALVHEPDIVLADEPTGNLDSVAGSAVLELFEELHRSGATIAMITHDGGLADRFSRMVTIRDGRLEKENS